MSAHELALERCRLSLQRTIGLLAIIRLALLAYGKFRAWMIQTAVLWRANRGVQKTLRLINEVYAASSIEEVRLGLPILRDTYHMAESILSMAGKTGFDRWPLLKRQYTTLAQNLNQIDNLIDIFELSLAQKCGRTSRKPFKSIAAARRFRLTHSVEFAAHLSTRASRDRKGLDRQVQERVRARIAELQARPILTTTLSATGRRARRSPITSWRLADRLRGRSRRSGKSW